MKQLYTGLRAILFALGLTLAAAVAPASAATLTFSMAGQYGFTDDTAWLMRPPSSDLSTMSTVSLASENCAGGEVCGTITLANKSPAQTGVKRDAQNHYLTASFTDGRLPADGWRPDRDEAAPEMKVAAVVRQHGNRLPPAT
ncbi:hypothetical protein [Paenirhodobacter populi]|uniref:hypothetical protein n=1 Tax=Paenirhodobacter populi TaxID=2306993 RepID=UPI000FE41D6C|nr:hypothetical protein [Sinirhodobacter populi]